MLIALDISGRAHLVELLFVLNFGGVILAIWLWLDFLVTSIGVIWSGQDYKLGLFEVVSSLIVIGAMGAIIAGRKK